MTSPLRILYAEDNALDADLTRAHFSERAPELELEIVPTGQACLDRLSATEFDLLLLDHRLPDLEGLEVLRRLARTSSPVPVVLVTGSGDEELVVKALRLGAVNYVPKAGAYLETLPELVRSVVADRRQALHHGQLATGPQRILYVEHLEMDIDLTLRHFADAAPHLEVEVTRSCAEALARLGRPSAYDAVLVDLRMPDQSGLDFVREAKRLGLALPPFIVLSGKGDEGAAIASLTLGAADYVPKGDGYLDRLAIALDHAIAHDRLNRVNARLKAELAERERADRERMRLEDQLRAAQKMEAIGSLAGGVAHDFNNLLSVILSYTEFAIEALPASHPVQEDLREVAKSAHRAAELTRQLLAFSRKQVLRPLPLSLNQVAAGVEKMLRRILGEDIDFVQLLAPDLGLTLADPGQLEQVLMNLVVNARDAMTEGGQLTIETCNVEVDEEVAAHHLAVKPGSYVQLAVSDTGCGMDEETRARIFEPFFTTKEQGKGTGLGLATVYGIVRQSGGDLWVYSEPGKGTTFKLFFPREHSATAAGVLRPTVAPTRTTGTETILLVEDEEALRKVAIRALQGAGYTVLTASDGEEALVTAARHPGEIHLLVTDVVMPRLSGKKLARELEVRRPRMKVIFVSGYTDGALVQHGVLAAETHFLAKPFTAPDLTRKVREVLDLDPAPLSDVDHGGLGDD